MAHEKSRTRAKSVLKTKVVLRNGVIVEMRIWEVSSDLARYPDGFKYSLYAVFNGKVLVGYDNHPPKGHHRHVGGRETEYVFSSLEKLRNDFRADLEDQMSREGLL